ncbi:MAG: hypothetical protein ACRD22_05320, partial [Terriglobia bacterium]
PTEHVVKYAIGRIRTLNPHSANHALLQSLVCQAATFEPAALREAIELLSFAEQNHQLVLDHNGLELMVNRVGGFSAKVGRHFEVAWCLWAAIHWLLNFDSSVADAISNVQNSVVAVLALDADQLGLFGGNLNTQHWAERMTTSELCWFSRKWREGAFR